MTYEDPAVAALRRLALSVGGVRKIAAAIDANWQSLDQIVKGVRLPSGAPKGVGAQLRKKLSEHYPGWLTNSWDAASGDSTKVLSFPKSSQQSSDVVIHQWDTGGAMGNGLVLREQPGVIKEWRVSDDWVRQNVNRVTSPKNLAIVTGFGDSMRGMFNPGDPLLVDVGVKSVDFDAIYFFRVADEGFIKRLQRIPGEGLLAISENKAYRDWTIKPEMDFEVFGRVVKVWRGEEF